MAILLLYFSEPVLFTLVKNLNQYFYQSRWSPKYLIIVIIVATHGVMGSSEASSEMSFWQSVSRKAWNESLLQRCCFSKTAKALWSPEVPDMSARTSSLGGPTNLAVNESMVSTPKYWVQLEKQVNPFGDGAVPSAALLLLRSTGNLRRPPSGQPRPPKMQTQ